MTLRPFSATLQKQFRDTLETPGAPEVIDDSQPVMPVAVIATVNTATSAGYTQVTDGTDTLAVNTNGSINTVPESNTMPGMPSGTKVRVQACISISMTQNTAVTIYTPTAGYDFYLTDIAVEGIVADSLVRIGDNISGNARTTSSNAFGWQWNGGGLSKIHFQTPIKISTVLKLSQSGATNSGLVSYMGFEIAQ